MDTTIIFNLLLSTNFFAKIEMEYCSGRVLLLCAHFLITWGYNTKVYLHIDREVLKYSSA